MAIDRQPRWKKWRLMPEVDIWQAVALSLNIEPDKVRTNNHAWMGAKFPFDEGDEFDDRLNIILANSSNRTHFPTPCRLNMGGGYLCGVRLSEFASWAVGIAKWENLPAEILELAQSENTRREREFVASFAESVSNGSSIQWRYWVHQMPTLTAAQAARLMCGLDPDIFENLDARPNRNDPTDLCIKAKKIQRLAETQGKDRATPNEWLEWATAHVVKVHDGFRLEIEAKSQTLEGGASDAIATDNAPLLPHYITTSELVAAFGGFMGVGDPRKVISEYPNWATKNKALIRKGRRGRATEHNPDVSAWDPVKFALNLLEKRPRPMISGKGKLTSNDLDAAFSMLGIDEWMGLWKAQKPSH